ncbi:ABC transporter ATP-binding protein [Dehalococcoidia bacterium]|nr:ABC transporter ATP-binding protein [Dehalococcoidia bacterium]
MALLEMSELTKAFGGLVAVADLALHVNKGEIAGLIGPNGAGKTTVFNVLTGVYPATRGKISFQGEDLLKLKPHQRVVSGIGRTFQQIRLFGASTVLDNVKIGLHCRSHSGWIGAILRLPSQRREEQEVTESALGFLDFVGLAGAQGELAYNLPYGHQRRLEIARALATEPTLLLLDEPAAGMNPQETEELMELIRRIRDTGITILLIEHDMKVVMGICERIVVLDHGVKIAEGTGKEIRRNKKVIEAYLGRGTSYA